MRYLDAREEDTSGVDDWDSREPELLLEQERRVSEVDPSSQLPMLTLLENEPFS